MSNRSHSPARLAYLATFADGPAYVFPFGHNGNTVSGAQRAGLVEMVEGSVTEAQLTDAGRKALAEA